MRTSPLLEPAEFVRPEFRLSLKQSRAWRLLNDDVHTEVFFGGGAGVGKSKFGCVWELTRRLTYPGTRGLIARCVYETLRDSTMKTYFQLLDELGYRAGVHYAYNGNEHAINWVNGSQTLFRHLRYQPSDPDYNRLGSTEYSDSFIDESPEVEQRAADVVASRLRYRLPEYNLIPKQLLTGNPGEHWAKYRFVYDKSNQPIVLPAHRAVVLGTIVDNPNKEFRDAYRKQLELIPDEYDRQRLLYGDWLAAPRSGRVFFPAFDSEKHQKAREYDSALPLHITWDFNSAPYMTLLVAQIVEAERGYEVRFLKEYCMEHPLNTTYDTCVALLADLREGAFRGHRAGLFMYGDYSGKSASTMGAQDVRHNYDIIENVLRPHMHNYSDRVYPNPRHIKARDFMNACFSGREAIHVVVHPDMVNTVRDLRHVKQNADGGILKEYERERDEQGNEMRNGVRYEKFGHCSQALYYLVTAAFRENFLAFDTLTSSFGTNEPLPSNEDVPIGLSQTDVWRGGLPAGYLHA